ncbi:hypothetical protein LCGC14_1769370 [marine sediment metagenome]|uniref:GGDEF domain-containing protein n=1 Tax=marine sediment metagenome TaxID=412755 RepID=A0A0F9GYS2_9ZZZZ
MILADIYEPEELVKLLEQSVPTTRMPLNQTKRSDYYFGGEDGKSRQFSRKQAGELLGNLNEAESQLRDYYNQADENYQIIEGIISPVPITKRPRNIEAISIRRQAHPSQLFAYKIADNGYIFNEHAYNISSSMLYAWLFRLEEAGVHTFYTVNLVDTARLLVAIYKNCQKPPDSHDTLNRYIKPRIVVDTQDPHIFTLMGIAGADLGEVRASALIKRFGTAFSVFMATVDELRDVEGMGKKTAEKLLTAIGREV